VAAIRHRFVETNGIRMHVAEAGDGPLVVLCHGFPESWYSWRHQLHALADAGFHAAAPDQRGYGRTDRPEDAGQYTLLHLVGDIVGLVDALGAETAVIAGHDWGAPIAWNSALLRPDRFRAVVGLSGTYAPRKMKTAGFLDGMEDPADLPPWLAPEDIDVYAREYERTGFTGGLNWNRCMDRTWELMAPFRGAKVRVPALFIGGDRDGGGAIGRAAYEQLEQHLPNLRKKVLLPGVGHWTQQEAPDAVNRELIEFLRGLD